jgi:hypothetical protein
MDEMSRDGTGETCSKCGGAVYEEDRYLGIHCGKTVSCNCSISCEGCHHKYSIDCSSTCQVCDGNYCAACNNSFQNSPSVHRPLATFACLKEQANYGNSSYSRLEISQCKFDDKYVPVKIMPSKSCISSCRRSPPIQFEVAPAHKLKLSLSRGWLHSFLGA